MARLIKLTGTLKDEGSYLVNPDQIQFVSLGDGYRAIYFADRHLLVTETAEEIVKLCASDGLGEVAYAIGYARSYP